MSTYEYDCNILYTQENSQICNMLIIVPNMNMTLVQAYVRVYSEAGRDGLRDV